MEAETSGKGTNRRGNGHIFKPKYKTRSGEVRESKYFYIQFYRNGVRYVENTHTDKITPAKSLLRRRLGSEQFVPPKLEKLTFDELAAGGLERLRERTSTSSSRVRHERRFRSRRCSSAAGRAIQYEQWCDVELSTHVPPPRTTGLRARDQDLDGRRDALRSTEN